MRAFWRGNGALSALLAMALTRLVVAAPATSVDLAAKADDRDAVRSLLRAGADVNAAEADGMTALHWAALNGDVELARLLVFGGANVGATTRLGGYTPVFMAAMNGDATMIGALLDGRADPNVRSASGSTPLMLAAAAGRPDAVRVLLDRGADANARESVKGATPLFYAAAYGRSEAVRLLAARGAELEATTKVVDLSQFARDQVELLGAPAPRNTPAAKNGTADGPRPMPKGVAGADRKYLYTELVGTQGGLTPLLVASRQGAMDTVKALVDAGASVNRASAGDRTTPLLIAAINGHFDVARFLLDRGADPNASAENGATPLYAVLNCRWAQKALYPQPRAFEQQHVTYLELMTALLDKGADPNARVNRKVWYSGYNSDFSAIDETGATPFWRAAYAADVDAMKLLVARGADPNIPTMKLPGRARRGGGLSGDVNDVSGVPPVPVGGPNMTPLHAASGPGYGEGFAGNAHRYSPNGLLPAVKYLVEELHADVNAVDQDGNTPLHNAAARGDNDMIRYLVSKGANVKAVNREGQTTVDLANGPVQRVQPFPDTIALLEKLGAKNNHKCVSC